MVDADTTATVKVRLSVDLNAEQLSALLGDSSSLAIIRIEGAFEHAMRKQLRQQLRDLVQQLGGNPFQFYLQPPRDERSRPTKPAKIMALQGGSHG